LLQAKNVSWPCCCYFLQFGPLCILNCIHYQCLFLYNDCIVEYHHCYTL